MKTKAAKRLRAGRNRNPGERYSGAKGRVKPNNWANMSTVLIARCRLRGLRITDDNLRAMRDPLEGHVLGRLRNDGVITESLADAGTRYLEFYLEFAYCAGMPRMNPPASSYGLGVGGSDFISDDRAFGYTGGCVLMNTIGPNRRRKKK